MNRRSASFAICACAVLVSIGINFTRVPIVYAFRLMTCEEYYTSHPPFDGHGDRCSIPQIEASTAKAVSFLGSAITVNGVANLIFTNWCMKRFNVKTVLVQQLVGPTIRLAVQLIGVHTGAGKGLLIVEISQLLGVVGGSTGYVLVLNTFIAELVEASEQTASFGRLQGSIMFGTAAAYLLGGLVSDKWGTAAAFQSAFVIMALSTVFVIVVIPSFPPLRKSAGAESSGTLAKILGPLRALVPSRNDHLMRASGSLEPFQRMLLAMSVFCGVLATGFIPILLQMFSTDKFGFTSKENGLLTSLTFAVRSIFLTFCFPTVIRAGRRAFEASKHSVTITDDQDTKSATRVSIIHSNEIDETTRLMGDEAEAEVKIVETPDSAFDLWFLRTSFLIDGIVTAATALASQSWHLYLAASLLPLASGSAPAARGVIAAMCSSQDRADALSALAMVEMLATLLTMSIFGLVFSALAEIGRSNLVFVANGGLAVVAAIVASLVKPQNPRTVGSVEEEHVGEAIRG